MAHHLWARQWPRKLTKAHKTIMRLRQWASIRNKYMIPIVIWTIIYATHRSHLSRQIQLLGSKLHVHRAPSRSRAILEEGRRCWRIKTRALGSTWWMWWTVAYLTTEAKEAPLQRWIDIWSKSQLLSLANQPIQWQRDLPGIKPSSNPNWNLHDHQAS